MKHKVSDLEGALLDAAVAKAEGRELLDVAGKRAAATFVGSIASVFLEWAPSTNWQHGGPIIDRERIGTHFDKSRDCWFAMLPRVPGDWSRPLVDAQGATPLIAAMRAYAASKVGGEVELP
jgi:hypothetical protein